MTVEQELAAAYAAEQPHEVARLFERMPASDGARLLAALEPGVAANVLFGADPSAVARAMAELPAQALRELVQALDPRAAVDALRNFEPERRAALLSSLPEDHAELLSTLASHAPDTAAGRLDPRAPAFFEELAAREVLERLLARPEGALHYLYAVDAARRLTGALSVRELLLADTNAPLTAFLHAEPSALVASDPLPVVARHPGWMKYHALPVIDAGGRYLGVLRYATFRTIESELGRALAGADPNQTASALAELCAIGASAIGRVAAVALTTELTPGEGRTR